MRAARADLKDVRGNASDGIHGASAGGIWQTVVFGFAGLGLSADRWEVQPCLPAHWKRLSFHFVHRGRLQTVDIHNP
jgi:trehalose/maltose hydrolase-like predicted phosphorylase